MEDGAAAWSADPYAIEIGAGGGHHDGAGRPAEAGGPSDRDPGVDRAVVARYPDLAFGLPLQIAAAGVVGSAPAFHLEAGPGLLPPGRCRLRHDLPGRAGVRQDLHVRPLVILSLLAMLALRGATSMQARLDPHRSSPPEQPLIEPS